MSAPSNQDPFLPKSASSQQPNDAPTGPPTNANTRPSIGPSLSTLWAVDSMTGQNITDHPWPLTPNTDIIVIRVNNGFSVHSLTLRADATPFLDPKGLFPPHTAFEFGQPVQGYRNHTMQGPNRWIFGIKPLEQQRSPENQKLALQLTRCT